MKQYIFAEYSNIFDNYSKKGIQNIIRKIDFKTGCRILSLLGYYSDINDKKILDDLLIKFVNKKRRIYIQKYFNETILITRHGVVLAWKYLLANSGKCNGNAIDIEEQIVNILKLILIMHEKHMLEDTDEIKKFVSANALFNYYDNPMNQSARAYYIFIKNRINRFNVDIQAIDNTFINNYGISIENYIYTVKMLTGHMGSRNDYRCNERYFFAEDWRIDPYILSGVSKDIFDELIQLLNTISFSKNEGETWAKKHIYETGEFSLFIEKPLIKLSDNCYIPIEQKMLDDLIFNELFKKIKKCYNGNQSFSNDFGYLFQEYIEYISTEVCNMSQGYYKAIPEFQYGSKRKRKDSPDFMILHEENKIRDTVLVIEVKSQRTIDKINDYMNLENSDLDKTIETLVNSPICQSITAITDIISKKGNGVINDDKSYYFLTVTMNNLPFDLYDSKKIEDKLREYSFLKVGGFESIGIEEYELFLQVLCYPGAEPFNWYIRRYKELASECSFKNFINKFDKAKDKNITDSKYLDPIIKLSNECFEKSCEYFLDQN